MVVLGRGGDSEIPSFRGHIFPRSVKAGPLWKGVRAQAGLEQASLLLLAGRRRPAGHRALAVAVPSAWPDCGIAAETIEDLTTRQRCRAGRRHSQREVSWVSQPSPWISSSSGRQAASSRTLRRNRVSAAVSSGWCVSLQAAQRLLQRRKAAWEWRKGSLMLNPPFLMEAWARSQASWMMTTWMIRS